MNYRSSSVSTIGSSPDLSVVHGYVDRGTSQSYKEHSSGSFNLDLHVYQNMDMMKKMSAAPEVLKRRSSRFILRIHGQSTLGIISGLGSTESPGRTSASIRCTNGYTGLSSMLRSMD